MRKALIVVFLSAYGATELLHGGAITSKLDPALSGATLIDFESAVAGPFTSLTISGVTFSTTGSERGQISSAWSGNFGATAQSLQNQDASDAFGVLNILFATPVSAFAFNWGASDNQWTLSAYDASSVLIESILPDITHDSNDGYTGIKQGSAVIKSATLSGPSTDWIFVDDFKFVTGDGGQQVVPEPGSMMLLGFGLTAVILASRRRAALRNYTAAHK